MKSLCHVFYMFVFMLAAPATTACCLDAGFLKSEPYLKTKQKIDISSITNEQDLLVLQDAINPIARFAVGMSFAELPDAVERTLMTEAGHSALRRPPLRNKKKRYSIYTMSDWKICGSTRISFSAEFSNLFNTDFWEEHFSFIKTPSGWQFDNHSELTC